MPSVWNILYITPYYNDETRGNALHARRHVAELQSEGISVEVADLSRC